MAQRRYQKYSSSAAARTAACPNHRASQIGVVVGPKAVFLRLPPLKQVQQHVPHRARPFVKPLHQRLLHLIPGFGLVAGDMRAPVLHGRIERQHEVGLFRGFVEVMGEDNLERGLLEKSRSFMKPGALYTGFAPWTNTVWKRPLRQAVIESASAAVPASAGAICGNGLPGRHDGLANIAEHHVQQHDRRAFCEPWTWPSAEGPERTRLGLRSRSSARCGRTPLR